MDAGKTGAFIAKLRGERGLTQRELAERIGVTDKAVSKWECGRGFPDIATLEIISKELGVSITELINGERFTPEAIGKQSDSAVIEALGYVKRMIRKAVGTLIIIVGACMLCSPLVTVTNFIGTLPIFVSGIIVTAGGVVMLTSKKSFKPFTLPRPALEGISLGALIAALILEALPNGVIMWLFTPPGEPPKYEMFSHFSLIPPFGGAHFSPIITAIMTIALTLFTIIVMILGKKFTVPQNALLICIIVTAAISVCPVIFGIRYVTVIGVLITVLLGISAIFRAAANLKR